MPPLTTIARPSLNFAKRMSRRFSIPRKWLLTYALLIVVPATVLLYSYYVRSTSILEEEVTRTMQQTLKQAGSNLTYRIEHVQDISNSAFMNPRIFQYLNSDRTEEEPIGLQLDIVKDLRYLVESVQTNSDVFRVRLFVDKSKLYANERINFFSLDSLRARPWFDRIVQANGGMVWTGVYNENFIDYGEAYILSCARMLRDPKDYDQISGVLMIDVSEKTVTNILADLDISKQNPVYLVDGTGTIIAHLDKKQIGAQVKPEVLDAIMNKEDKVQKVTLNNEAEYVVSTPIPVTGWKMVAEVQASSISQRAVKMSQYSGVVTLLAFFGLFIVLVFVLLAFIVRGMNRRVQQVIGIIRREGAEGLDELPPSGDGDFSLLERSVDRLIHRVRTLVEQTYLARVQEREAELRALQAQINPHFLYNTLDTINWIAIGRGANDISQMIDALAKYFRLSLNKGRDLVSVDDELNLARVYLEIQHSRFPGSFEYVVESETELGAFIMPKLTLQPIVENALLHGIRKSKSKRGTIRIVALKAGDDLVLTVSDDGIGMEEERAKRLLSEPPSSEMRADGSGSSYGLYNVNERIALYSGIAYGLSIQSEPGAGTTVTVRLKAISKAKPNDDKGTTG
ncbi:cache domain-containing sensor histidine kinase [Paenibacillus cremeus]|uniref:histidine kinase n=1 Tax=Paenibacillus cremeus TaxID=2163881 RepID=A0A559KFS7_9BACL|nr:sensor histidine kinase [Paenibacillus cremeus]TVY10980.1 sensor histidine kinase [Paenibacillus cremeus]